MQNINFDFINLIKLLKDYLIKINSQFRDQSTSYRFTKRYFFKGGLNDKLQPFMSWFKRDIKDWMNSAYGITDISQTGEFFSARITIYYYWGSGLKEIHSVTDNYQYFTNNTLPSRGRIAKWKHFIIYSSVHNRFIPMNMLHSIDVDLEWHNYPERLFNVARFISHEDTVPYGRISTTFIKV